MKERLAPPETIPFGPPGTLAKDIEDEVSLPPLEVGLGAREYLMKLLTGSMTGSHTLSLTLKKSSAADAAPEKAAEPPEGGDDLTRINGIGQVIAEKLNKLGISTLAQIAEMEPEDVERVNEQLNFKGRIERENWIEQARELVKS